jgi:TM2 domain-containing membrane protein YozV
MDYPRPLDPREPQQQQQQQAPWQAQQQQQWQAPQQQWQAPQQQWPQPQAQYPGMMMAMEPQKSWTTTAFLCYFLGVLGIHRFYTGRVVSGIFQLLTFGGCGIWTLVDLIMIITGQFTDRYNRPLYHPPVMGGRSSWVTTAMLCLFLGWLGIHRFYTGHVVSGIIQLLTGGGFGIWILIDIIMIFTDSYRDSVGAPLTRMEPQVQYGMQPQTQYG